MGISVDIGSTTKGDEEEVSVDIDSTVEDGVEDASSVVDVEIFALVSPTGKVELVSPEDVVEACAEALADKPVSPQVPFVFSHSPFLIFTQ